MKIFSENFVHLLYCQENYGIIMPHLKQEWESLWK